MEIEGGGHFVQERGEPIARAAFNSLGDLYAAMGIAVDVPLNQNSGSGGCDMLAASGKAVSQKAHWAVERPICQCVRPHPGQWFTVSA